jgi:outer membrane protein assembly factor BamB
MAKKRDRLFIGVGGNVVAIDPATGDEIWRQKLKSTTFVTVMLAGNRVYAGAGGELFCLDAESGEIVWNNKLKGLGLGIVAFSNSTDQVLEGAAQAQRAAAAAAG